MSRTGAAADPMRELGVHLSHCNFGEWPGICKYGDEALCPALSDAWSWFGLALQRHGASGTIEPDAEPMDEQRLAAAWLFALANGWTDELHVEELFDGSGRTPEDRWRAYANDSARIIVEADRHLQAGEG